MLAKKGLRMKMQKNEFFCALMDYFSSFRFLSHSLSQEWRINCNVRRKFADDNFQDSCHSHGHHQMSLSHIKTSWLPRHFAAYCTLHKLLRPAERKKIFSFGKCNFEKEGRRRRRKFNNSIPFCTILTSNASHIICSLYIQTPWVQTVFEI